ncbi:MAG: helicase HerA domain-containing protein [Longimicrobiales bacterium]
MIESRSEAPGSVRWMILGRPHTFLRRFRWDTQVEVFGVAELKKGDLFLGGMLDKDSRERTEEELHYGARRFTTHGVIVGMTGSGKTGLGVVLLEEVLGSGVPAVILDPKGDMGNLLLNFPELRGSDFRPWIDDAEADRKGKTADEFAEDTAGMWKEGLAGWGISGDRLQSLKDVAEFTIYTPGSTAGVPINVLGSLAAPTGGMGEDPEGLRDEIEGFTSSLLTLAGVHADPIASPEHVLIATLIEHAWSEGRDMDLASLISQVQKPPMRKLGVFEMDTFFPPADRMKLAMRLNGLVASPSFQSWLEGVPLSAADLLYTAEGKPKASVIYMAHLSDEERQFVVTLILSKMITWMRGQPGTSDLRALIYMDEVYGFVPPTAVPPSKKPILTILKQARAHGLGMILSTQNPVDLDYKAMSNAGTWMVGRLQTERDKKRILEALESATGGVDVEAYDGLIGALDKRQFMMQSTKEPAPQLFTTRWAMSYLRGALTREEVRRLTEDETAHVSASASEPAPAAVEADDPVEEVADDETLVAPVVPDSVDVRYLDPGAPWSRQVGSNPTGSRYQPGLAARVSLLFDDRTAGVDHQEEWEAVAFPLTDGFDAGGLHAVDFDDRDFDATEPEGARYVIGESDLSKTAFFRGFEGDLKDHLYRNRDVTVLRNGTLKLYSRVGESREAFLKRCDDAAEDRADQEVAKLKGKYETKIKRAESQLASAERRVRELEVDVSGRRQTELVSVAGELLSMFAKGRRRSRSLSGFASRRSLTRKAKERLSSAEEKVADKTLEIDELEDQLGDEIQEIMAKWDEAVHEIEEMEIGLEKTDVKVDEVVLFWAPV